MHRPPHMNGQWMMNGERAGRAGYRLCAAQIEFVRVDGAHKEAVSVVMLMQRSTMRTRQQLQRAFLGRAVINQNRNNGQRLIGMGNEGPVLMPLQWRANHRRFDVDLAVMQPDVLTKQGLDQIKNDRTASQFKKERIGLIGFAHALHDRLAVQLRGLKIEQRRRRCRRRSE